VLGVNDPYPFNALTIFFNGATDVGYANVSGVYDAGSGNTVGTIAHTGSPFGEAVTFFQPSAPGPEGPHIYFNIPSVSYNVVPEPVSAVLLLIGGSALAISRRARKRG
jgi:hypothetical protein